MDQRLRSLLTSDLRSEKEKREEFMSMHSVLVKEHKLRAKRSKASKRAKAGRAGKGSRAKKGKAKKKKTWKGPARMSGLR